MNVINTQKAPGANRTIFPGVRGKWSCIHIRSDPGKSDKRNTPADIAAQAKQSCENVKAILVEAGSSMEKVFKTTCFLADMADFAAFNDGLCRIFYFKTSKKLCCRERTAEGRFM